MGESEMIGSGNVRARGEDVCDLGEYLGSIGRGRGVCEPGVRLSEEESITAVS